MSARPADKQKMLREHIEAGNELDEWAIPRKRYDGAGAFTLPERVRILAGRYHEAQQRAVELERVRDLHVPDYPPVEQGEPDG